MLERYILFTCLQSIFVKCIGRDSKLPDRHPQNFIANRTKAVTDAQKLLEDRLKGWRRVDASYIPSAETIYAFN